MKALKVSELQANTVYVCRLSGNKMLVTRTYEEPAKKVASGETIGPWKCVDGIMWDGKRGEYLYCLQTTHGGGYFYPADYQFTEEA